jgi:hypothetical protein
MLNPHGKLKKMSTTRVPPELQKLQKAIHIPLKHETEQTQLCSDCIDFLRRFLCEQPPRHRTLASAS